VNPSPDDGVHVSGCGRACDCCSYWRATCGPECRRMVFKFGDRFFVFDDGYQDGLTLIGEAEPGFKPLPEDALWAAKVEDAQARGLPYPTEWTKRMHVDWEWARGVDLWDDDDCPLF
jgi:hypothetical protein